MHEHYHFFQILSKFQSNEAFRMKLIFKICLKKQLFLNVGEN